MNRTMLRRLESLEQKVGFDAGGREHALLGTSDEDLAQQEVALRASARWQEGDRVFKILLVAGNQSDK